LSEGVWEGTSLVLVIGLSFPAVDVGSPAAGPALVESRIFDRLLQWLDWVMDYHCQPLHGGKVALVEGR